jgi:hypothetical protein
MFFKRKEGITMNGRDLGLLFGGFVIGVATGLMFKKKDEPTKEELVKELNEDCNFVVEGYYSVPQVDPEKQAKWEAHVINVMNKFSERQANIKEPYSKENPPKPLTAEEMQLYTILKNKANDAYYVQGAPQLSKVEQEELKFLTEYETARKMYTEEE